MDLLSGTVHQMTLGKLNIGVYSNDPLRRHFWKNMNTKVTVLIPDAKIDNTTLNLRFYANSAVISQVRCVWLG